MSRDAIEAAVKSCYSTWGETYFDEYYGPAAPYPPVHRDLLRMLILESGAATVLDAGCGPASFLRGLTGDGLDLYGFDLTPEMVVEARRVLGESGVPESHVWEGSVLAPEDFAPPAADLPRSFDAAVCVGVLPHIPAESDAGVIASLRDAVKPGGLVLVEARNQLFSLFTMNRYSHQFFMQDLVPGAELRENAGEERPALEAALTDLEGKFRMDLPPVRKGKATEPGYDEVLSRTHNPLELREQVAAAGFTNVRVLFYHFHCLPPMYEGGMRQLYRRQSLAMENPEDWRGYFMASAFVIAATRS